ncbi:hypothetical protein JXA40_02205 [bacterium]|nr:hypothetical protein [candidate division CSSED10-310 bacterium]
MARKIITVLIFAVLAAIGNTPVYSLSLTLEEVQRNIEINNLDWVAGETWVSRLSDEEFDAMLGLRVPDGIVIISPSPVDISGSRGRFDWREQGGVSPVKAQGNCGSCWAFCLVHMLESYVMIYDGYTPDLSEQQLVSCNGYGYSCNGGWLDAAGYFINPGMADETCMPYQAANVPCQAQSCEKIAFADDWAYTGDSVAQIKAALEDGPVACAIYASSALSYYTGGCFSNGSASNVNHGVLIVGYDDDDCSGQGGWIVKNSWGAGWGDNGFFRIKYGDSNIGYGSTRIFYTATTTPKLVISGHSIDDSVGGDGDGVIEPGEDIVISVTLGNSGNYAATGVGAVLTCVQPEIGIPDNFAAWPDIPAGSERESLMPHFQIRVPAEYEIGGRIDLNLSITCNEGTFSGSFVEMCGDIDVLYYSGFEGTSDDGWTHEQLETQDDWQRGNQYGTSAYDPDGAYEGSMIWGNDLGPSGWNGDYKPNVRNRLKSRLIPTGGCPTVHLMFQRWLTVEKGSKDHARIYINQDIIWENPDSANHIDTAWAAVNLNISEHVTGLAEFEVIFELESDGSGEYGGWNIDDFMVIGLPPDGPEPTPTPVPTSPYEYTPTPVPDGDVTMAFHQTRKFYGGGDPLAVTLEIANGGDSCAGKLYVCLAVFGEVFFYPSWTETLLPIPMILDAGQTKMLSILDFEVPAGVPDCGPFYLCAVLTEPGSYDLLATPALTDFWFR